MRITKLLLVTLALLLGTVLLWGQPRRVAGDWPSYGGTNWSQKYSPLDQITAREFRQPEGRVDVALAGSRAAARRCRRTRRCR